MALPQEEWLHLAKLAPVNGTGRHHHLRERRPNLVVRNLSDRYTAYCMACKQGAVLMKEHVKVTGLPPPALSQDLTLPFDMVRLDEAEKAVQDGVLGFLASKHMDMMYLPPDVFFSKQRMRVLVGWDGGWLGRDTTERSPQKWLTYNRQQALASHGGTPYQRAIVVEDPFSFFKVKWALRDEAINVYSSLGTSVPDTLMVRLLEHDRVDFFYDGDEAGYKGAARESKRLRAMGVSSLEVCAPAGLDPKDMVCGEILPYLT